MTPPREPDELWEQIRPFVFAFGAAAVAYQAAKFAKLSPAERKANVTEFLREAAEKEVKRREHRAAIERAKKTDKDRWQTFLDDVEAQRSFEAEYYIQIPAPPSNGVVTTERGGRFWDTHTSYIVTLGESSLRLTHHDDGGYLTVALRGPGENYGAQISGGARHLIIGEWDGKPTDTHRQVASMLRQLQQAGHYAGQEIVLARPKRWEIEERHFAAFATRQGWPGKRDAERDRVDAAYYRSR